jgi:deoxyribose-phosphate aldolase
MNLAPFIDHTLLRGNATKDEILKLCAEAKQYGFASVCVNSCWVTVAAEALSGSDVKVCSVVGFPLGAMSSFAKAAEARYAVADGAQEVDFVLNVGDLKSDGTVWRDEMTLIREAVPTAVIKVILETGELTDAEIIFACRAAAGAGLDFVKTSTGFGKGGATVEHIRLMAAATRGSCDVKASGGIRDYATALAMVDAGATRLGCSAGIAIVTGAPADPNAKY